MVTCTTRAAVLGALALALWPSTARANIAAPRADAALVGAPGAIDASPLRVVHERIELRCHDGDDGAPRCRFTARYTFHNPTGEPVRTVAAFYGYRARSVRTTVDGVERDVELSEAQARGLDSSIKTLGRASPLAADSGLRTDQVSRSGFQLAVAAGRRAAVVVRGVMRPGRRFQPSYVTSASRVRHRLLGSSARTPIYDFAYLVAPIRTFGESPPITVHLVTPAGWETRVVARSAYDAGRAPRVVARRGRRVSYEVDGDAVDVLELSVRFRPGLLNGGPLLAAGATVDDSSAFRLRLGYEVAWPGWLLYSLAVETDFVRDLVLVPMVEAASAGLASIVPSLGVGLGAPARLLQQRTVGVRIQLSIHWPFLGALAVFDIYPGLDRSSPAWFQAGLYGQVGL